MAQKRRMFSDEITTSDAFLDMPGGSQLLYFHLGMNADDDGFVGSPKMIMRILGSSEDEFKILLVKKFILSFNNGICVVKHWRINNQIRKDRYTETKYLPEKKSLFIRKNGSYTKNSQDALPVPNGHFSLENIDENDMATIRQPLVAIGKVREGKVREGKVTISGVDFNLFWAIFPDRRKGGKRVPQERWNKLSEEDKKKIIEDVKDRKENHKDWLKQNGDFIPAPEVYLNKQQWLLPIIKEIEVSTKTIKL